MSNAVAEYWENRYRKGRGSGRGSRGRNANRKAAYINRLIKKHRVRSVIDWGCGDGRVASRIVCQRYFGLDVSEKAVELARAACERPGWSWEVFNPQVGPVPAPLHADLALSLDVIFHLTEDDLYGKHLELLFSSAPLVCIASSNKDERGFEHVLHREFAKDIPQGWEILEHPETTDIGFWVLRRMTP